MPAEYFPMNVVVFCTESKPQQEPALFRKSLKWLIRKPATNGGGLKSVQKTICWASDMPWRKIFCCWAFIILIRTIRPFPLNMTVLPHSPISLISSFRCCREKQTISVHGALARMPALKKKNYHPFNLNNPYNQMATVIIPTPLRKFTNQTAKLQVSAKTIGEIIQVLTRNFPDLKKHLLDDQGKVRSFVNIFAGDDDIRDLQQENTAVNESTVVSIVPAIAGGLIA